MSSLVLGPLPKPMCAADRALLAKKCVANFRLTIATVIFFPRSRFVEVPAFQKIQTHGLPIGGRERS
jgi:hypothetical protein